MSLWKKERFITLTFFDPIQEILIRIISSERKGYNIHLEMCELFEFESNRIMIDSVQICFRIRIVR